MWKAFHHPDISLPVVRRRAGLELLEMLGVLGDVSLRGGWALMHTQTGLSREGYNQAIYRLSKQGLVVKSQGLDTPRLTLSEDAEGSLNAYFRPEKFWNRRWNGIWYLLVYDVPEADRSYRNVLRDFLKKQRVGCFQKSVWVTPHDIRPQYSDLQEAAAVEIFACLFESKTVLGMSSESIVLAAWDFDRLHDIQKRFCDVYEENLDVLQGKVTSDPEELLSLATAELDAFRSAFVLDPLLPTQLLPHDYLGKRAYDLHLKIVEQLRMKLVG